MSLNVGPLHIVYTAGTYVVPSSPALMLVVCDTTAGPVVLMLPSSASVPLASIEVKKRNLGNNAVTLVGAVVAGVADRIEGVASYVMSTANRGGLSLRSDGSGAWWAVPYAQPLPANVVMLPPPVPPTLSYSGFGALAPTLVGNPADSAGQVKIVGGAVSLVLAGTLTVTFGNPASFAAAPVAQVVAGVFASGATVTTSTLTPFATCTATAMTINLTGVTLGVSGVLMVNWFLVGTAAN